MKQFSKLVRMAAALVAVFLVMFVLVLAVEAQTVYSSVNPQTIVSSAFLGVSTTNSPAKVIAVDDAANVALWLYSVGNAKGTNGITVSISSSIDGTTWKAGAYTMTITGTGTTPVNVFSNLNVVAIPKLRVDTIISDGTAAAGATNTVTLKAISKKGL